MGRVVETDFYTSIYIDPTTNPCCISPGDMTSQWGKIHCSKKNNGSEKLLLQSSTVHSALPFPSRGHFPNISPFFRALPRVKDGSNVLLNLLRSLSLYNSSQTQTCVVCMCWFGYAQSLTLRVYLMVTVSLLVQDGQTQATMFSRK